MPWVRRDVRAFESHYKCNSTPWDMGHIQPAVAALLDAGEVSGKVLEVGCGTARHAIAAAQLGLDVTGVDFAPTAIERAQKLVDESGVKVDLHVVDIANPNYKYTDTFDTVMDIGLYHVLDDEQRAFYVSNLGKIVKTGGKVLLMCISDRDRGLGPRKISQKELRDSFASGWSFNYIRPAICETGVHPNGAMAWIASISKI